MDKVMDILKRSEALLEGHFLLSSGKHSNRYVQCARALKDTRDGEALGKIIGEKVADLDIDLVVGPAMGGVIIAYEVGRALGKESIFTERKDNIMTLRRGFEIKEGQRILIVEDVVTTGKSTLEVKKLLEELGGVVVGVGCIVDRRSTDIDLNMPVYSAIKLEIESYDKDNCPLCNDGVELYQPGSRKIG
ncbi:MAG: orotate phosphoribosyltransferase [Anaeromicrobium sp.]|jgi:orotate phosphoribosyltransferase|uniref:orotate phosphoribosyltransferase n=1 Tax=Anaeromicrobium sp. TaxID=1929132 RepID=UPI0025E16BD2|nr:orotate phosphoribosyltransferase [Anaeromicrobium sp.]MCT4595165.1 orotate phosphoribosyltransferase [Anaeromicrobium sp.]